MFLQLFLSLHRLNDKHTKNYVTTTTKIQCHSLNHSHLLNGHLKQTLSLCLSQLLIFTLYSLTSGQYGCHLFLQFSRGLLSHGRYSAYTYHKVCECTYYINMYSINTSIYICILLETFPTLWLEKAVVHHQVAAEMSSGLPALITILIINVSDICTHHVDNSPPCSSSRWNPTFLPPCTLACWQLPG